ARLIPLPLAELPRGIDDDPSGRVDRDRWMRQGDAGRAVEHSPGLAEAAAVAGAEEPAAGFAGFGLDEASLVGADAGDGKEAAIGADQIEAAGGPAVEDAV